MRQQRLQNLRISGETVSKVCTKQDPRSKSRRSVYRLCWTPNFSSLHPQVMPFSEVLISDCEWSATVSNRNEQK